MPERRYNRGRRISWRRCNDIIPEDCSTRNVRGRDMRGSNSLARIQTEGDRAEARRGREGMPQDFAEAVSWYRKAADQGYAMAQDSLGNTYAQAGESQDYAEAVRWYRRVTRKHQPTLFVHHREAAIPDARDEVEEAGLELGLAAECPAIHPRRRRGPAADAPDRAPPARRGIDRRGRRGTPDRMAAIVRLRDTNRRGKGD